MKERKLKRLEGDRIITVRVAQSECVQEVDLSLSFSLVTR